MVRVCGVVAALAAVLATARPAGAEPPPELKLGLAKHMFKDVPAAMVNAAARPFQNMIQEKAKVKGSVEVVPDHKALIAGMKAGTIDIAVFHGFEYAWVKNTPGLVPLVSTVPNCGKVQACLIVNKDSPAKEPKDLKGACVLVPRNSKAHCFMYLDHLRKDIPQGDCCPAKTAGLTPEEALGEVASGAAEAVIVDVAAWKALQNNLPGCYKCLRVLAESKPLPSAVVVYREGSITPATAANIKAGLIDCVKTPIGKTFALFWQLQGFAEVGDAYNNLVAECLKAYPAPAEEDK